MESRPNSPLVMNAEVESPDAMRHAWEEIFHQLGNKLLPIIVHAELGVHRCQDPNFHQQFEKILRSANEARDLLTRVREQVRTQLETGTSGEGKAT